MADSDSILVTQQDDFNKTREIYLTKNNNLENKSENLLTIPQNIIHEETVKEGILIPFMIENLSISSSTLSTNNIRQQSTFLSNSNKNQTMKGAFNNFQALINHKNYLMNHHHNYLISSETSKLNFLRQNSAKKINFDAKNKNIFQTVNFIKNKNFKIVKEEKQVNLADTTNLISHVNNNIQTNSTACKKFKSNEAHLDCLISINNPKLDASDKLFSEGIISLEELDNLPQIDKKDSDSEFEKVQKFEKNIKKKSNDEKKNKTKYSLLNSKITSIETRKCENKICDLKGKTSLKLNFSKIKISKGKHKSLCNQCMKAYKNKQYCYYCVSIYKDNSNDFDGKDWICCDFCDLWVKFKFNFQHHINCEKMHSNKNIDKFLKQDPNYKYSCPWCRIKKKNTKEKFKGKKKFEDFEENAKSFLGNKIKNKNSGEIFEDFKPKLFRNKEQERIKFLSNNSK